jgi:hypothetical protein
LAKELRGTPVHIQAPAEQVWAVLTDFASFPRWNPFIRRASGELVTGQKISVNLRLYGKTLVPFKPTVTVVEAPRELRWLARMGAPGVFDVERFFVLEPETIGGCTFRQGEDCTGFLAGPMLATGLEGRILAGYERLNQALKKRAERLALAASQNTVPPADAAAPIPLDQGK